MDRAIHSKKLASVRTAGAIHSKKFVSHSNGLSYPFKSAVQTARSNVAALVKFTVIGPLATGSIEGNSNQSRPLFINKGSPISLRNCGTN